MKRIRFILNIIGSAAISFFGLWMIIQCWDVLKVPACDENFCSVMLTDFRPLFYLGMLMGFSVLIFGLFDLFRQVYIKMQA